MDPSPPASLLACLLDDTDIWTGTIVAFTIVIVLISIYQAQPSGPAYALARPARAFHPPSGANKPEGSARQLSILDLEVC
ncbi:uncharacterized protein BO72DRAFT_446337 [Aspergillus fijiensis CBS 313.89]|uniref:Uncharacterized protein n=1 Tax=Aspergillus fijiensis CBS 313.89 TaxID=1448319 RepID=A0A8G1W3W4_9EURO|nr:uncharacterized protein BO72DRAFT_446337 [Aspergillus fijiensis CBS 313.89]RAK79534.1 hypothetical protein BO72DRAFT_446337 [Aspergillus fijiensis CBS 313.89]